VDLAVYFRVLRRHRLLVAGGILVALTLSLLSLARLDFDGLKPDLSYRESEVWISSSTLFVTQDGFPWGRSILDDVIKVGGKDGLPPAYIPRYGDPGRYAGLAQLYAALARSDGVRHAVLKNARSGTRYETDVAKSADNSTVLPLIYMNGYGPTAASAEAIANRAATTFQAYLARQQASNDIPPERRVQVVPISQASDAELFAGRSLVRSAFVFLLVLTVFVAVAFVAENAGFKMPRPPEWTGRGDRSKTPSAPRDGAEQLATSMAGVDESAATASAAPAEPRKIGEQRRVEPVPADEEPVPEEPPARVQRWA
jgi:hypothetical protein